MTLSTRIGRGVVALLAVIALSGQAALGWGVVWAVDNHQWLSDRAIALQFTPSQQLASYASRGQFTAEAEVYFYASRPEVVPAIEFDNFCSRNEPGIGVLGCYRLGERRIFLFDVTDPRLEGMEPVIAAHEMLHAVWDRFSSSEKDRIAVWLENSFASLPDSHPLRERIQRYEDVDPSSRIPELYALMGTEVATLSPELEAHYGQYFLDRQVVVGLASDIYAIFANFGDELESLVAQLESRLADIDSLKAQYELEADILGADIAIYNDRVARYNDGEDIDGAEDFEDERIELTERQETLRSERVVIEARIDEYNSLLDELTVLNQELTELNQGINIDLEAQESLEDTETVDQSS